MKRISRRMFISVVSTIATCILLLIARFIPGIALTDQSSVATSTSNVVLQDYFDQIESDVEDIADFTDEEMTEDETERVADLSGSQTQVTTNATITHVVDGDTFDADLDDVGEVRIRMLGVNTPETVDPRKAVECFGKDASDFSKHALVVGDRVLLEADPQADERDKYGRLLRNVILADGTDYNAKLVEKGYAYAYLSFPLNPLRKTQLKKLENEAKAEKRGLWGAKCK